MASEDKLADAFIEVRADDSKLDRDLNAARGKVEKGFSGFGKNLAGGAIGALAGLAFTAIKKELSETIKVTVEGERAVNRLGMALKLAGAESRAKELNDYADTLSHVFKVSDDTARGAMTLALDMGMTADQAKEATRAAIGLADVLGTDTKGAIDLVARAQEGNFSALQRHLPKLKEYATIQEKLNYLNQVATEGLKQRQAAESGLGGSIDNLELATTHLQKAVGGLISQPLAGFFNAVADSIESVTPGSAAFEKALLQIQTGIAETQKSLSELTGDTTGVAEAQKQLDDLGKEWDALGERAKAESKVANDAINLQVIGNEKLKNSTKATFGKIEDLWKDWQRDSLTISKEEAANAQGMAAAKAAGNGGAVNPLDTGQGGESSGSDFGGNPLDTGAKSKREPESRFEQLTQLAYETRYKLEQLQQTNGNTTPEMMAALEQKIASYVEEMRGLTTDQVKIMGAGVIQSNYSPTILAPDVMQKQRIDLNEMMQDRFSGSTSRALRVKDEGSEESLDVQKQILEALKNGVPAVYNY